jgi:PhoH-like ATPase
VNKVYIFDTSCFVENPYVLSNYDHSECYIPIPVLEELDNLKNNRFDNVGMNARAAIHYLDTNNDINFCGDLDKKEEKQDNNILASMNKLHSLLEGRILSLVTRDLNLKVKARALGFESELPSNVDLERRNKRYTGIVTLTVDDDIIDDFYGGDQIYPRDCFSEDILKSLNINEYLILKSNISDKKRAIARYRGADNAIKKLSSASHDYNVWMLKPRNVEQIFCADALTDPDIKVVSLVGIAGSGKTLMAVAAGIQQVFGKRGCDKLYRKMIVSRPIQAMGSDIGFLPGTMEEKMSPWIQPIIDNLEFMTGGNKEMVEGWFEKGKVEVEALTYIRGRSLPDVYIIIDEAQNLTSHEVKTIMTRVGENSKIILTGDVEQIDNFKLTEFSNGLSYAIEKFRPYGISAHVQLTKGERSEVAELAAKIL